MCPDLLEDYRTQLEAIGRYEDACGESPKNITGGADEKATHDHYTWRFGASSMRTRYLMLDPDGHLQAIADDLLTSFADGKLAILELPCGAGAGVLGFLSLVANMRRHKCLARLPLEVSVVAGDHSPHARGLYETMLDKSRRWLEKEGIRVSWTTQEWDASDLVSTTKAVDAWFKQTSDFEEHIVLIAAFSGAAANNFKHFEDSFKQIAARLHDRESTILLVEPESNKALAFLSKLDKLFGNVFSKLFGGSPTLTASFKWRHPFKNETPTGHISVVQYERGDAST